MNALRAVAPGRVPAPLLRAFAFAAFALFAALFYVASWNGVSAGFLSDDAVYLLLADGFSPYRAADPALTQYVLRQSIFPPGYPLLLALTGAGSSHLLLAHVVTTSTLLLALAAFAAWVARCLEDRVAAALALLAAGLLPGMLLYDIELMSEAPYLMWSLAALWLAQRKDTPQARDALLIALCVGAALLTRTAGWSLFAAFGVWLSAQPLRRRYAWLLPALLPMLLWMAYKALAAPSASGYGSLWGWVLQQSRAQGASFVWQFTVGQLGAAWRGLLADFDVHRGALAGAVLALVLLLALPPAWRRLRERRLDAWYLLICAGMVLAYPFPSYFERLVLPWWPILLCYAALGAVALQRRVAQPSPRPLLAYGVLALVLFALAPSLGFVLARATAPVAPQLAVWKHTRYWYRLDPPQQIAADVAFRQQLIALNRDLAQTLPPGACVFAVHTAIAMLYGGHIAYQPPPPERLAGWPAPRPDCAYLLSVSAPGVIAGVAVPAFYPLQNLDQGAAHALRAWPDSGDGAGSDGVLLGFGPAADASAPPVAAQ